MQGRMPLEILSVDINTIFNKELDILALALQDREVERCSIFVIDLVDIHLESLSETNDAECTRVRLCSTMHRRQLVMHLGRDACIHLLCKDRNQLEFAQSDRLMNRLHFLSVSVLDQSLNLRAIKIHCKILND